MTQKRLQATSIMWFFVVLVTCLAIGCDLSISLLSSSIGTTLTAPETPAWNSPRGADDKQQLPPAKDLVKDWDQPDVTLFVTGRLHGYMEPCGCTGLETQKGGLMRRHTVQKILQKRGWNLVNIDAGNHVRRFGQQPVIKIKRTYETLCKIMKYDVAGFGPDDLKIPPIELLTSMINAQEGSNPFTCANMTLFGDSSMTNRFRIVEKNGKKIGVTTLIGNEHFAALKNQAELGLVDMNRALATVIPQMQQQQCDLMVLVAWTSEENCRQLAQQFPFFDLLVTTSGAGDPWLNPQAIQSPTSTHVTQMIQVGVKGMYVGLVGLYTGPNGKRLKYERVTLDHRYKDSPQVTKLFGDYQKELEMLYKGGDLQDIRPRQHPSGYKFVGSERCSECHDVEYDIWEQGVELDGEGPHFKATADIVKPPNDRGGIPRHFDPECISCHATGWNPQNFYPYQTGFLDLKKDSLLHGNGCENCHGPGSEHVEAEEDDNDQKRIDAARKFVRVTLDQARDQTCYQCHDIDNSPDFLKDGAFDKYWEQIKH